MENILCNTSESTKVRTAILFQSLITKFKMSLGLLMVRSSSWSPANSPPPQQCMTPTANQSSSSVRSSETPLEYAHSEIRWWSADLGTSPKVRWTFGTSRPSKKLLWRQLKLLAQLKSAGQLVGGTSSLVSSTNDWKLTTDLTFIEQMEQGLWRRRERHSACCIVLSGSPAIPQSCPNQILTNLEETNN